MPQKTPFALEYIRALRDDRTLTTTEKLTAVFMASHAGHDGTNAHPGHKLTGEETATSERTSKRTVASLVEKGWLIQTASGRGNNRYASVYRLAIPQSATGGTLDGPTGQTGQAKVPNETGQGAISDSQSATGGPTNQPVEITLEIPVSQISDLTDRQGKNDNQSQRLTDGAAVEPAGQEGSPPADGEAGDGWEDYQSGEEWVSDLNVLLAHEYEGHENVPVFNARYLKGGAARLGFIVRLANEHQFTPDDLATGLFWIVNKEDRADHDITKIEHPERFLARFLSTASANEILGYAGRGKRINAYYLAAEPEDELEGAPA